MDWGAHTRQEGKGARRVGEAKSARAARKECPRERDLFSSALLLYESEGVSCDRVIM